MDKIKIIFVYFSLGLLFFPTFGQQGGNFIENGSFEGKSKCPDTGAQSSGQFELVLNWMNPSTGWPSGSPDYFNACAYGVLDVPKNYLGYQNARTGVAYCGIAITSFDPSYSEFREYIEAVLNASLTSGTCYLLEMYVSSPNCMTIASDAIQVYFSDTAIIVKNDWNRLNLTPQLFNSTGNYADSLNWRLVSGVYVARGGEKFITIGNFLNNANSNTVTTGGEAPKYGDAYVYIDDVSLYVKTGNCFSGLPKNSTDADIYLFPIPTSGNLTISGFNASDFVTFTITDCFGQSVLNGDVLIKNNSINIETSELKDGLYQIQLKTRFGIVTKKFVKIN